MIQSEFTISNRLGLHARAAAQVVKTANRFISGVRIRCGKREVNGKSIMGILTLEATRGSQVTIILDGPDEKPALVALGELIEAKFGEE